MSFRCVSVLLPGNEVERKAVDAQEWYQEVMGHQHAFQVVSYHCSGCVLPGTASLTTKVEDHGRHYFNIPSNVDFGDYKIRMWSESS